MKKLISVLILFLLTVTALIAEMELSTGGGVFYDGNFGSGAEGKTLGIPWSKAEQNNSFGAYIFFDAVFAEASISFSSGTVTGQHIVNSTEMSSWKDHYMQIGFTLLAKYPIGIGNITLFPLAGINYNCVISATDKSGSNYSDPANRFSQFGIMGGAGIDCHINRNLYLRAEGMFQFRFPSERWKSEADGILNSNTTPGAGFVIRIGTGYCF